MVRGGHTMRLTCVQDIEAPAAFVFRVLADFDAWERGALRRGADVNRTDRLRQPGPGMTWIARFAHRGRDRTVTIRIDALDAPGHLGLSAFSPVVEGQARLDLMELGARRTRLHVTLDAKPKTFAARLYFQSLRLARARVQRTLTRRIAGFATGVEDRFRREHT